jgi:ferredoxin-NADP reductase
MREHPAGGIGIAPMMSMLRALADRNDRRPFALFCAYRRLDRLTFDEAIDQLRGRLNLTVVVVLAEPRGSQWSRSAVRRKAVR